MLLFRQWEPHADQVTAHYWDQMLINANVYVTEMFHTEGCTREHFYPCLHHGTEGCAAMQAREWRAVTSAFAAAKPQDAVMQQLQHTTDLRVFDDDLGCERCRRVLVRHPAINPKPKPINSEWLSCHRLPLT